MDCGPHWRAGERFASWSDADGSAKGLPPEIERPRRTDSGAMGQRRSASHSDYAGRNEGNVRPPLSHYLAGRLLLRNIRIGNGAVHLAELDPLRARRRPRLLQVHSCQRTSGA